MLIGYYGYYCMNDGCGNILPNVSKSSYQDIEEKVKQQGSSVGRLKDRAEVAAGKLMEQ